MTSDHHENLIELLLSSKLTAPLLTGWKDPGFFLAGGAINQTIWNKQHSFPLEYGIEDLDLVYFDPNLSEEKEKAWQEKLQKAYPHTKIDVKNQARVHLWIKNKLGYTQSPYTFAQECSHTSLITATAVCVSLENRDVYAPYGLQDIYELKLRRINISGSIEQYDAKVDKWKAKWPKLVKVCDGELKAVSNY